ncbi:LysR family transcriptional regulator [Segnochrobactrum spirostomi]|uniref:LysR family transcriptional regulator n=1 Tax=Segnochrobactrum spirostomi TaxID=2608987 RepID=A0A6A7XYN5_9HYPH|nr:LysR family transcriptional regulator [Segnochrobactrum spirostomi]MQT11438.1 LysR family transcriptional regulator [Segnochrobactrum spirostomi]
MASLPDWTLYRTFLAVLEEGSLSGAARALGLAQPTIGRHVDALEAALGLSLFVRAPHGLSPTDAALALRPHAEAMRATAAAMVRTASGVADAVAGTVRVSASEMIGAEVLPPIVAELLAAHPGLAIELVLNNRTDDLLRREADIAVRMVAPTQDALVARKLGVIPLGFHAHRDYLARRGVPTSLADFPSHSLIGFDRETVFVRGLAAAGLFVDRDGFALRTDSDLAHFAAIRAGCGIGMCQIALAARHPALVRVLPEVSFPMPTWLVMHEDLRRVRRFRVVFDALAEGLSAHVAAAERTGA